MAKEKTATADTTATELTLFRTLVGCELQDGVVIVTAKSGAQVREWAITLPYALELRDELSRCLREATAGNVVRGVWPRH